MSDGPNLHGMGLLDNKGGGGGEDKDGLEGWVKRSVVMIERIVQSFCPWLFKVSGVGETSATSGLDPKSALDAFKTAPGLESFLSTSGGTLAKIFAAIFSKPEFGMIQSLLQGMGVGPAQDISRGESGNFVPGPTPGAGAPATSMSHD